MKKSVLLGIIGLAAGVATSYGQGYLTLDNYSSGTDPAAIYGANVPANGITGANGSGALSISAWTIGLYFVGGSSGLNQAAGNGMPDASLALGTGPGSTVPIGTENATGNPGFYGALAAFNSGSTAFTTVTLEIVAYDSAASSYATAAYRGHSAAFSMSTVTATSPTPIYAGDFMPGILSVTPVPEPTTLALAGLGGLATLVMSRRKKA